MRFLVLLAGGLLLGGVAFADDAQLSVPCAEISPNAVAAVPAPFDAYMKLFCYKGTGQGLMPVGAAQWLDGTMSEALSAMDDRTGPDGKPRFSTAWYVSLNTRAIAPPDDAALRRVLAPEVRPLFIDGARIIELDAATSAGEVKQEFIVSPADAGATHGIKLLVECYNFCRGDKPWILGIAPAGAR